MPDMITTAISLLVACLANRYITPEFTALRREHTGLHGAHGALTWAIFSDAWPCLNSWGTRPAQAISSHMCLGDPNSVQYYSRHSLTASNHKRGDMAGRMLL